MFTLAKASLIIAMTKLSIMSRLLVAAKRKRILPRFESVISSRSKSPNAVNTDWNMALSQFCSRSFYLDSSSDLFS